MFILSTVSLYPRLWSQYYVTQSIVITRVLHKLHTLNLSIFNSSLLLSFTYLVDKHTIEVIKAFEKNISSCIDEYKMSALKIPKNKSKHPPPKQWGFIFSSSSLNRVLSEKRTQTGWVNELTSLYVFQIIKHPTTLGV